MTNPFFKNNGPFKIDKLLKLAGLKNINKFKKHNIYDVKDLSTSTSKDITFFNSKKYFDIASKTKAQFCVTTENLKNYLPNDCNKIVVENVLIRETSVWSVSVDLSLLGLLLFLGRFEGFLLFFLLFSSISLAKP